MTPAERELEARFRRHALIGDAASILHWDTHTMMPPGAAAGRADQTAELAVLQHEILSAPELSDLLDAAEQGAGDSDPWRRANLREMRRRWRHATALPADLVAAMTKAGAACEQVWRQARPANDFAAVRPHLDAVFGLVREVAAAKAAAFSLSPYDALLDQYEAGLRCERVDDVFADLLAFLPGLLDDALARQASERPPPALPGPFAEADQHALARQLMAGLGFDFARGRLDLSAHPFTGGTPDDLRLTTRYAPDEFLSGMLAVLHETGHGLYERNLPADWRGQPVGESMGMAVHESQSLIIEMQACRSDAYLGHLAGAAAATFAGTGAAWSADAFRRRARHLERGLIRVDADEISYPLHVILRYRLERALLSGDLVPADLPGAWAEAMRELVGIVAPDDKDGCLQDIHWMQGSVGYFPTYTLGAIAAAQLFAAASAAHPEIDAELANGRFDALNRWLVARVHKQGRLHASFDDLLIAASGRPLDVAGFERHLRARYLA